jgi:DNA polymerase III delta prime subunit
MAISFKVNLIKEIDMLTAGLIIIIFALLLRLLRDPVGYQIVARIDSGEINNTNRHQYRAVWRFFLTAWKAAMFLGIGLVITKLIQS